MNDRTRLSIQNNDCHPSNSKKGVDDDDEDGWEGEI